MFLWNAMFIPKESRMKGYSWSKEDYLDLLIKKYPMREAIFIEGEACSKCHMMKPHCQSRAEHNWYEFQVFRFDDAAVKEFQIESVPMLVLKENWAVNQILDMDGIVSLISNQHKDG